MVDKHAAIEPGSFYHIYNRANGNEKLFLSDDNYKFFLKQFKKHISPVAELYCFCLMPNHFHLLVKIKDEKVLQITFPKFQTLEKFDSINIQKFISKQFSNLFSSYTQAFNKEQNRKGSLFMKNFNRKRIDKDEYLKTVIEYIHLNPIEAGIVNNLTEWKYSSYNAIKSFQKTKVMRSEVIDIYDDLENFVYCHKLHIIT
jgi:REP element-mobilizing transposase RayT